MDSLIIDITLSCFYTVLNIFHFLSLRVVTFMLILVAFFNIYILLLECKSSEFVLLRDENIKPDKNFYHLNQSVLFVSVIDELARRGITIKDNHRGINLFLNLFNLVDIFCDIIQRTEINKHLKLQFQGTTPKQKKLFTILKKCMQNQVSQNVCQDLFFALSSVPVSLVVNWCLFFFRPRERVIWFRKNPWGLS